MKYIFANSSRPKGRELTATASSVLVTVDFDLRGEGRGLEAREGSKIPPVLY